MNGEGALRESLDSITDLRAYLMSAFARDLARKNINSFWQLKCAKMGIGGVVMIGLSIAAGFRGFIGGIIAIYVWGIYPDAPAIGNHNTLALGASILAAALERIIPGREWSLWRQKQVFPMLIGFMASILVFSWFGIVGS